MSLYLIVVLDKCRGLRLEYGKYVPVVTVFLLSTYQVMCALVKTKYNP